MPRSSSYHALTALLAVQLAGATALCAYEQGSYYVFDLVESDTAEPIMGRIAIPAATITAEAVEAAQTLPKSQGEFEIDFNTTMQTTTNSSFELTTPVEETTDSESISFSTDNFDFGTSSTVFGE